MPSRTPNFAAQLETYLHHLVADRYSAVPETSRYGYLQTLLNAVGELLPAPHVRAVIHPASRGAGIPDLGLLAAGPTTRSRRTAWWKRSRPMPRCMKSRAVSRCSAICAATAW